eukprot:gene3699-biopygen2229
MRLRTHNWYVLDHSDGMTEIHGPKVEKLEAPLFPETDPLLRELNAKILSEVDVKRGGGPASSILEEMFAPEGDTLYKGRWKLALRVQPRRVPGPHHGGRPGCL